jgi:hypothetical protein
MGKVRGKGFDISVAGFFVAQSNDGLFISHVGRLYTVIQPAAVLIHGKPYLPFLL